MTGTELPASSDDGRAAPGVRAGSDAVIAAGASAAAAASAATVPRALRVAVVDEEAQFYRIIQSVLVAHLHGNAAQISVEIGRGDVPSKAQPSFLELEEALQAAPADA